MRVGRSLIALCLLALALPQIQAKKKKPSKGRKKGADYYAILGVEEDDDAVAMKKAYRAKSLEFHPDKCKEEECQTKFIEASNAHEVLSDPEKRKTYDEHGEEGLKEGGAGGQSGEQARAMFRQFFGREPDGNVRIINRGGQMHFQEEGEPGPSENIYDDSEVQELTSEVWNSYIKERDQPWAVQFYKPNDDDSVAVKDEYVKFGKTFSVFLNVAAVNCRKQRDICSGASISQFPAVRWFTEDKNKDPEVFDQGTVSAKLLGKWASSLMPDHTTVLDDKHKLRHWLDNLKGPAVILFTDKKETPPMWKALSLEYNNRASLAVVLGCDKTGVFKTPLQREYDVYIPGIIRVDPIDTIGKIAEKFTSQIKMEVLKLWMLKVVALGRRAGPVASFKEWSKTRYDAGDCAPSDGQFCFLWLKMGADPAVEEATKQLAHKYKTDPIKMMWVNTEMSPSVLEAFGLEVGETDYFVAFRPKRGKFKVHEGPLKLAELDSFVDGVLNGGPLQGKVKAQHIEL